MHDSDTRQTMALGTALITAGAMLAAAAIVGGLAAISHMEGAAALCGPETSHCILCVVSAASLLASLGVVGAGVMLRRSVRLDPSVAARG
ncbi:hypothetical protein [Brevundimonas sp.]|uniref:hypothetical protein n=1 Tax=Brevundimonas sp. TaxID=1871086 RepID=UPI002FCB9CAE